MLGYNQLNMDIVHYHYFSNKEDLLIATIASVWQDIFRLTVQEEDPPTALFRMVFMMGGGIGLRYSGLVSELFVAVFYTGLGCALAGAGILFWVMFFRYTDHSVPN